MNAIEKSPVVLKSGQDKAKSKLISTGKPVRKGANVNKRCDRVVHRNKYERNSPEMGSWWHQLFGMLEDDAAIPIEEQRTVIEDAIKYELLDRLQKILNFRDKRFKEEPPVVAEDLIKLPSRSRADRRVMVSDAPSDKRVILTTESVADFVDLQKAAEELGCYAKEGISEHVLSAAQEVPKSKMYTDFFKRKPSRAAVWRTLPPLSMSEMNLNQKADALTEQIATDFIDWLRDLGGDEELSLSVQSVIEMFEIGFHANAATSLKVNVKEMPSVPRRVAVAKGLPKKAKRSVLHREIRKDMKASKKKTMYTAFGRHLPSDLQARPPAENYFRKWMICDRVPERLASMAAVWQGITHLKSTRAYCEFLIEEKPDIKPPKYLADCGLTNLKNLQEHDQASIDMSMIHSMASA